MHRRADVVHRGLGDTARAPRPFVQDLDDPGGLLREYLPPLEKIRARRQQFMEKPDRIVEILHEGSRRARTVAARTMEEVRSAVHLTP